MEELLNRPRVAILAERVGRKFLAARVREVLAQIRQEIREGSGFIKILLNNGSGHKSEGV